LYHVRNLSLPRASLAAHCLTQRATANLESWSAPKFLDEPRTRAIAFLLKQRQYRSWQLFDVRRLVAGSVRSVVRSLNRLQDHLPRCLLQQFCRRSGNLGHSGDIGGRRVRFSDLLKWLLLVIEHGRGKREPRVRRGGAGT